MSADSDSHNPCPCLGLYVIVDEGLVGGKNLAHLLNAALDGGADAIQFRAKRLSKRGYYEKAVSLLPVARRLGVPFFVNDHIDVALAISADGIHLGQNDLPCAAARELVPSSMLLGISTHSVSEAEKAVADGADYVAIGSVFPTGTKENLEAVVGLRMIGEVKSAVGEAPLIAIGGIDAANAGEVIRAGADGVAVASAVISADDPGSATRELKEIVRIELDRRETAR